MSVLRKYISSWGFILCIVPFIILLILGTYTTLTSVYGSAAYIAYSWALTIWLSFIISFVILLGIGILIIYSEEGEE